MHLVGIAALGIALACLAPILNKSKFSSTMKRIDLVKTGGFQAEEHLVTSEVPEPTQEDGRVLIEVHASAINPVDWKMADYGVLLPKELPASLGCDVAGIALAPESLKGKRVVSYLGADKSKSTTSRGAFVEKVIADIVAEIPDDMTFAQAASLPVGGLTAVLLLEALTAKPGEWVLVWGASSSVGFNAVQLAKQKGFKVIAVASSKHQVLLTKELGADAFVDYRKGAVQQDVVAIIGPEGSVVGAMDCIGSKASFGMATEIVADGGVVSTVSGFGTPDVPNGKTKTSVSLGDFEANRVMIEANLPLITKLKTQAIRSVSGPLSAGTVQKAFQISKDGVSGEKVVIEWTK